MKGYVPLMPSHRSELSDVEVDALIHELLQRKTDVGSASQGAELVVDPVCHMRVRAEPSAPNTTYAERTVYFCCESCRDAFLESPARYPLTE